MKSLLILSIVFALSIMNSFAAGLPEKYPPEAQGRDAVFGINRVNVSYDGPDRSIIEHEFAVKIYTPQGRSDFGDIPLFYNRKKDVLKVIKAGTFAGSEFIPVEDKGINELTADHFIDSFMYGDFVEKIYSMSKVDPGNVVYMHYMLNRELVNKYLNGILNFSVDTEVMATELSVTIPSSQSLLYSSPVKPEIKISGDEKVYKFTGGHYDRIQSEINTPPFSDMTEKVIFSAAPDWDSATEFLKKEFLSAQESEKAITEEAEKLFSGLKSDREKILAAVLFLKKNIKDIYLPLYEGGSTLRKPSVILKSGFGDQKDKTMLFITLLKAAGIKAVPVFYAEDYSRINTDVPAVKQLTAVLPAVKKASGNWGVIDIKNDEGQTGYTLTNTNLRMLVLEEKIAFVPFEPYFDIFDEGVAAVDGILDASGNFSGTLKINASGFYDTYNRVSLKGLGREKMKIYYEKAAELFYPGTILKGYENSDPQDYSKNTNILMTVESNDFAIIQDDLLVVRVPSVPFLYTSSYSTAAFSRKYPYSFGSPKQSLYKFKIKIPENYEPLYLPENITYNDSRFGEILIRSTYDKKQSVIIFEKRLHITQSELAASAYGTFKKANDSLTSESNNLLILRRKKM